MAKKKHWVFNDNLYGVEFHLWRCEPEVVTRFVRQNHSSKFEWEGGKETAGKSFLILKDSGPRSYIWVSTRWKVNQIASLSVLVHETFHATIQSLYYHGLEVGGQSEEAFAYYQGWLFRKCLERLA